MQPDIYISRLQFLPLFDMLDRERGVISNAQAQSWTQSSSLLVNSVPLWCGLRCFCTLSTSTSLDF